jgi:UDP-glucuronate 4-epimerase
MKVLVTGAAGFIGMHVALRLLERGDDVVGLDNMNDYYDVDLKKARFAQLTLHPNFEFRELDVADRQAVSDLFVQCKPDRVVHLAAQAGVRYSLENPHAYIDANIQGFMNILEGCRQHPVEHLVYASSSSVYGSNETVPFSEQHNVDHPVSLYAATKKANELMAHTYSHLYSIPTTGLRFFTVYGPWGRPDMAPILFTNAILSGKPIKVFNKGDLLRDFTYIDDITEGVLRVLDKVATTDPSFSAKKPNPASSAAPYRVLNIGNSQPTPLLKFIEILEVALGRQAQKKFLPMQQGDVYATSADTSELNAWVGFKPSTPLDEGVAKFVHWYREFYQC